MEAPIEINDEINLEFCELCARFIKHLYPPPQTRLLVPLPRCKPLPNYILDVINCSGLPACVAITAPPYVYRLKFLKPNGPYESHILFFTTYMLAGRLFSEDEIGVNMWHSICDDYFTTDSLIRAELWLCDTSGWKFEIQPEELVEFYNQLKEHYGSSSQPYPSQFLSIQF
ncbi:hypothetical protein BDQ17DRAFT_1433699 [Cyathus striatus]|nr:hypothetical protein BDQ17DRAFT_1433699 [Cyathus striatus]